MIDAVTMSTAWLGPIEYFAWLAQANKISIEYCENYVRQTYRNRCEIATANGKQELAVTVVGSRKNHVPLREMRITYDTSWNKLHWRSIESAYNNSPFFLYYRDELEHFFKQEFSFLIDLNEQLLNVIIHILKLDVVVDHTSLYLKEYPANTDLRHVIIPEKSKLREPTVLLPKYTQVFEEKNGFLANLSIIDLIFNKGPEAKDYLRECLPLG